MGSISVPFAKDCGNALVREGSGSCSILEVLATTAESDVEYHDVRCQFAASFAANYAANRPYCDRNTAKFNAIRLPMSLTLDMSG